MPEHAKRRDWGETVALLGGFCLLVALPNRYTIGSTTLTVAVWIVLGVACLLSIFWTIVGVRRASRAVMLGAAAVLALTVIASLSQIVLMVVYHSQTIDGVRLMETAVAIWTSNVIVFAVAYHWIGEDDFLFPRSERSPKPLVFLDYTFVSFTTATAFSPTDTPPLTTRARMCMMLEATISLATIAIAAARAVNILK